MLGVDMPGTHGALTKAGRVRQLTPKVEARPREKKPPRLRLRRRYRRLLASQSQSMRR